MPESPPLNPTSRANRWLVWVLAASVACGLFVFAAFLLRGDNRDEAWNRTVWPFTTGLFESDYKDDSWGPMGRAFLRFQAREDGDIYGIFFDEGRKFQYPPTSLLVFYLVPDPWLQGENFKQGEMMTKVSGAPLVFLRTASRLAVILTIAASIAILEIGISRLRPAGVNGVGWRAARIGIGVVIGLTYYPVVKAYELGQIQVFLNALTAVGVLAHLLGWRARSGFILGLCCLVKPQFAVLLIWALVRRNWRLAGGFVAAVLPLGLVSLAVFGWDNHIRYIGVIREIARVGETYWANQSVNGFMNRLLGNGEPVYFSLLGFAPYHRVVHAVTIGSSLVILGLAFYRRRAASKTNQNLDLAVIIVAATMASPVAWEHHYGAFLPLFALALPACLAGGLPTRLLGLALGASFLAMGVAVLAPDAFFSPRSRGWMGSHLFFGAALFYALLLYLRHFRVAGDGGRPPMES
jgi:alpha-1,2-mannosyltransferase